MTISAKIIADSISPQGIRLTSLELRYPKFIHGELMTHRVFSRNASSSRAIPVSRMIADLRRDPALPVFWGSNKPGMQAGAELEGDDLDAVKKNWLDAMEGSILWAELCMKRGLHKQLANRILEPWAHINTLVTSTEWANFYALRRHPDAQPEMKALADAMWDAMHASQPMTLLPGQWHLPYISDGDLDANATPTSWDWATLTKCSVARCARVSYKTHEDKTPTLEEDLALYERLVGAHPLHASPAEHQATPDEPVSMYSVGGSLDSGLTPGQETRTFLGYKNYALHGNFHGWIQYRKTLKHENISSSEFFP